MIGRGPSPSGRQVSGAPMRSSLLATDGSSPSAIDSRLGCSTPDMSRDRGYVWRPDGGEPRRMFLLTADAGTLAPVSGGGKRPFHEPWRTTTPSASSRSPDGPSPRGSAPRRLQRCGDVDHALVVRPVGERDHRGDAEICRHTGPDRV